jgi:hypothetical protein
LRPRDRVAVFAYDRATGFTTDHARVAGVVERFRRENDAINSDVASAMSGLAAVYGSGELPPEAQARLDRVFAGAGSLPSSTAAATGNPASAERLNRDVRNAFNAAADAVVAAGRAGPASEGAPASSSTSDPWAAFDQFVSRTARTLQDAGNLNAAIAYMQRLEGEKHLVFVTERGMRLPRAEDSEDIARAAADARVAIDVLQTGGVVNPLTAQALRGLSEMTGGMSSISEYSRNGLDRLDAATRTGYLLGYYPSNSTLDGAFRTIAVKVARPGVSVIYRRGYNARVVAPVFDQREYAARYRVQGAVSYAGDIKDIGVTLSASLSRSNGQAFVNIGARIDPTRLSFEARDGLHVGWLAIAVVPMNANQKIIDDRYKRQVAHLEYDDQALEYARRVGIPYEVRIPVPSETRYIRLVVYDAGSDLVGSAGVWVQ